MAKKKSEPGKKKPGKTVGSRSGPTSSSKASLPGKRASAKPKKPKTPASTGSRASSSTPKKKPKQLLPRYAPIPIGMFVNLFQKHQSETTGFGSPKSAVSPPLSPDAQQPVESLGNRLKRLAEERTAKEKEPGYIPPAVDPNRKPKGRKGIQWEDWRSHPGSHKKGKTQVLGKLRLDPRRVRPVKRPHVSLIRHWYKSIKNLEDWHERDGSYHAIATFTGDDALEQLERAFRRLPIPAYFGITFFFKKDLDAVVGGAEKIGSAGLMIILRATSGKTRNILLEAQRTPTFFATTENFSGAMTLVQGPDLYEKKFGLAVSWPVFELAKKERKKGRDSGWKGDWSDGEGGES